jgi:hexosaminidase
MQKLLIKPVVPFILILLFYISASCQKKNQQPLPSETNTHGIVPLPKQLEFTGGKILLGPDFTLVKKGSFKMAESEAENLLNSFLNSFRIAGPEDNSNVSFRITTDSGIKDNAYKITITTSGIEIRSGNEAGAFWAVQSLKQYFLNYADTEKQATFELPCLKIYDEPKYGWRGFHLDVARHFFSKEYLLKIIDWLAYYKFNKFHLHLSDDQGWRVESKRFPLLNEIGSWREFDHNDSICINKAKTNPDFAIDPRFVNVRNGKTMYGGFYTQKDLQEIVDYANAHFIEIIPEIDMPGHMSAAIRAYPQLSCTGSSGWGTEFSNPICPCNSETFDFAYQIWDEISRIFPSGFVHIGADEVEKDTWNASSVCTDFRNANNLTNVNEIQSYFVVKLQKHLENQGKTVIAWDDVTDGKIDNKLCIMYWRDWVTDAPARAAANGNPIIFTRWDLFYLSGEYSDKKMQQLLEFDSSKTYSAEVSSKIIGFQGCVWSEEIPSEAEFEAMVFPRLQALSEVNWSGDKNWYSFKTRMAPQWKYLKNNHINLKNQF